MQIFMNPWVRELNDVYKDNSSPFWNMFTNNNSVFIVNVNNMYYHF